MARFDREDRRKGRQRLGDVTDENKLEIAEMYLGGFSVAKIAYRFRVSEENTRKFLKAQNILRPGTKQITGGLNGTHRKP